MNGWATCQKAIPDILKRATETELHAGRGLEDLKKRRPETKAQPGAAPERGRKIISQLTPQQQELLGRKAEDALEALAFMDPANIFPEEFPRFDLSKVPQYRETAVKLLRLMGPVGTRAVISELQAELMGMGRSRKRSERHRRGSAADRGQLAYLVDDVRTLQALLSERVRQINQTNSDKRYEEAERVSRELLSSLGKPLGGLKRDVGIANQEAKELGQDKSPRLSWLGQQLTQIGRQQGELQTLSAILTRTIQKNDAQGRANVLIELGNQSLREGNIDDTFDKYTLALGEQPDQPQLAQHLAQLKKQWEINSAEHGGSRRYVYQVWPGAELPSLEPRLPKAEQALDELEKARDRLAALKLLKVNEKHLAALDQLVAQLAGKSDEEDRAEHEKYVALVERLANLQRRTAEFCEADMPRGLRVASEPTVRPARDQAPHDKASPKEAAPAKPPAAQSPVPPEKSSPVEQPRKAPKSKPKSKSPLDEEEPPLGQAKGRHGNLGIAMSGRVGQTSLRARAHDWNSVVGRRLQSPCARSPGTPPPLEGARRMA